RAAVLGQRHPHAALHGADLGRDRDVLAQPGKPVVVRHDVVVEEHHPVVLGGAPSGVARGGGSGRPAGQHTRDAGQHVRHWQRFGRVAPVVDENELAGERWERRQQRSKAGAAHRGHDDADSGHWAPPNAVRRRTANGPIASRSTGADPNSSIASRGVSTIGRPAVFSEVLTTTGRPVRRSKAASISATSGSVSAWTVCTRAVPSTWTTAGMRSRHSDRTRCTKSMYGLGYTPSKRSANRSARTIGAIGRNCSRPLTLFIRTVVSRSPGWARSERCPSARGPYSLRPWNQATMPLPASTSAASSAIDAGRV